MTSVDMPVVGAPADFRANNLPVADATTYASWFACLADPTRVRLLHHVATRASGATIGEIAEALGIGQPTVSHHVRKLAEVGFVKVHKDRTSTVVTVNPACCTGLPHAADAVMGVLPPQPCCPADIPDDVSVRALVDSDRDAVRRIYAEGIATGNATFDTEVPDHAVLEEKWLPGHRWVAEIDGAVVGWAAATAVSSSASYSSVAETAVYVAEGMRGRGVGKALLRTQVLAADAAGLWTLQNSIFPENRAAIALHHSAGFRTVGVRERIVRLDGRWRDTVLLERRGPIA
ncbi:helix-turn-helix domain-containing GNAT family N-acetyltransferase [Nocardia crassostreae]|uniref:helix-turn-helix domain-containing GNAT family N-acetyltransferase n=1 Tax=Nocardia crassostreae TaxID=53428 RepID=UPI0008341E0A|nr:metalloregulator ArsR/SmtB family transcription factor [Nocardia crassostreae]